MPIDASGHVASRQPAVTQAQTAVGRSPSGQRMREAPASERRTTAAASRGREGSFLGRIANKVTSFFRGLGSRSAAEAIASSRTAATGRAREARNNTALADFKKRALESTSTGRAQLVMAEPKGGVVRTAMLAIAKESHVEDNLLFMEALSDMRDEKQSLAVNSAARGKLIAQFIAADAPTQINLQHQDLRSICAAQDHLNSLGRPSHDAVKALQFLKAQDCEYAPIPKDVFYEPVVDLENSTKLLGQNIDQINRIEQGSIAASPEPFKEIRDPLLMKMAELQKSFIEKNLGVGSRMGAEVSTQLKDAIHQLQQQAVVNGEPQEEIIKELSEKIKSIPNDLMASAAASPDYLSHAEVAFNKAIHLKLNDAETKIFGLFGLNSMTSGQGRTNLLSHPTFTEAEKVAQPVDATAFQRRVRADAIDRSVKPSILDQATVSESALIDVDPKGLAMGGRTSESVKNDAAVTDKRSQARQGEILADFKTRLSKASGAPARAQLLMAEPKDGVVRTKILELARQKFSSENFLFLQDMQDLKATQPLSTDSAARAKLIHDYIGAAADKEVNIARAKVINEAAGYLPNLMAADHDPVKTLQFLRAQGFEYAPLPTAIFYKPVDDLVNGSRLAAPNIQQVDQLEANSIGASPEPFQEIRDALVQTSQITILNLQSSFIDQHLGDGSPISVGISPGLKADILQLQRQSVVGGVAQPEVIKQLGEKIAGIPNDLIAQAATDPDYPKHAEAALNQAIATTLDAGEASIMQLFGQNSLKDPGAGGETSLLTF